MFSKEKLYIVGSLLAVIGLMVFSLCSTDINPGKAAYEDCELLVDKALTEMEDPYLYDLPINGFEVIRAEIRHNENLSDLLINRGVDYVKIIDLANRSRDVYDVRKFRKGKPYTIFMKKDSIERAAFLIYEIDMVDFVVFDLEKDSIYRGQKEVYTKKKTATGIIQGSLYLTLQENDISPLVALELGDVYAWAIDFYRLQKGDKFKVIYNENYVDGKSVGIDKILSAVFTHMGSEYYAFYYEQDDEYDYFDEEANSLRKAFLKAPLKFSRISSRYSKKRFHPIKKRVIPHLGTDYAAPTGTPIMAVGDGIVTDARYKKNNGNYVKIRHNSTYSTQYLHMSKFGSGIKSGVKVKQGQVIGYVGSTGLATGPHVCFRFWKNGAQVDPYKQKIPSAKPVKKENVEDYNRRMADMKKELDLLNFPTQATAYYQ